MTTTLAFRYGCDSKPHQRVVAESSICLLSDAPETAFGEITHASTGLRKHSLVKWGFLTIIRQKATYSAIRAPGRVPVRDPVLCSPCLGPDPNDGHAPGGRHRRPSIR
jgi:hypothetical protein